MSTFGAVKIEGDKNNPKIVSKLKYNSIESRHLKQDDTFLFKNLVLEDDKGDLHKLKVDKSQLKLEKLPFKKGKDGQLIPV